MTQNAKLLNWLETHDGVTTAEATDNMRLFRLSERIRELQRLGYNISHTPEMTSTGARVIRYRLTGATKAASQSSTAEVSTTPFAAASSREGVGRGAIANAAPTADQLVHTVGRDRDGKRIEFSYVCSGYADGKPARR